MMNRDDWKKVQRRLVKLGFNPGPIDGIRGRMTVAAVKRFQASHHLVADGIVGPRTYAALFGEAEPGVLPHYDDMPWFQEALHLIGTREVAGPEANEVILDFADTIDIDYADDDIPWCGLFVAHCIGAMLGDEPLPANPLGARNWLTFGEACEPQLGSVLVFWRGKKNGWQGHVGFYHGEDSAHFHVLGGNQSNAVNIMKIERKRLLGARWPLTAGEPTGRKIAGGSGVAVSENEA
jgi:uncharacterized protein (TIGR02594 family)